MGRITLEGTLVRRIDLHHESEKSNKDYRISVTCIEVDAYHVYTEHGPAGNLNQGRRLTPSPVSYSSAMRQADQASDDKQQGRSGSSRYDLVADKHFGHPSAPATATPATAPGAGSPRPPKMRLSELSAASRARLLAPF